MKYKVTNALIAETNNPQILDLAAGFNPRGLTLTRNTEVRYVDLDLPIVTRIKKQIIDRLQKERVIVSVDPTKFHLESGDVLDPEAIARAMGHLTPGSPTTILTEGLLHYFDLEERATLARNIATVLRRSNGGVWITDMPTWEGITERDARHAQTTSVVSRRDVPSNRFGTHEDAKQFFAAHGLALTGLRNFLTVIDELSSPAALDVSREQVETMNRPWSMWTFELAAE